MKWTWTDINIAEETIWIPPGSSVAITTDLHCMAIKKDGTWQALHCNASRPYICKNKIGTIM